MWSVSLLRCFFRCKFLSVTWCSLNTIIRLCCSPWHVCFEITLLQFINPSLFNFSVTQSDEGNVTVMKGWWLFTVHFNALLFCRVSYVFLSFVGSEWSLRGCCWFSADKFSLFHSYGRAYVFFHSSCIYKMGPSVWIFYHSEECWLDQVMQI